MNPKQTLEKAAYAFAATHTYDNVAETSIYKGTENTVRADNDAQESNRVHPSITLIAEGDHTEVVLGTKLFRGMLLVRVEADGMNITDATFDEICLEVFAVWDITTLKENLSAALLHRLDGPHLTALQANIVDTGDAIQQGTNWQKQIVIDCVYGEANL